MALTRKRGSRRRPRLEIIPFIDIMFFLLATFMMVSLTMIRNEALPVHLPKASSSVPTDPKDRVTITVAARGELYWNRDRVSLEELRGRVSELKSLKDPKIYLNADKDVPFEEVVTVLDVLRKDGIYRVAIQTAKPSTSNHAPR
ncbi:ExbD/TolR family protein [Candidatus Methylacidithermus pantelleriae]|uniref:Biopolymer transport protein ExbD/TolR n=1 Tax=Candidatus Methylacidithermus pantelleriae TaxID=2744239 RepID=A0A8J2BI44_9BACT|nr:biopolymer transporter ExbD [Candidatus Methylacidithermus pantelleriae]CAF0692055.1 Biopolymer transport protein ExbD/TolR [Candidatus Methylacidithermus pantelleriae]